MAKPRALIISRNLPPLQGGIERLVQHAIAELSPDYDCDVIGPTGCRAYVPLARKVWELPPGLPWFHIGALPHLLRRSYQLIVAGNGLVAPLAGLAAAFNRCRYAVFVHGLDLVVESAVYRALFLPWIRRADHVIANSRYTARAAQERGVRTDRVAVVNPGVELPLHPVDGTRFRAKHGIQDRPILLSVGRLVRRKGIAEFITQALPSVLERSPDACVVVIGGEPRHAASSSGGTLAAIRAAVGQASASSVLLLGAVGDDELAEAYAAADVFVFPVIAMRGDVEGFGMVALEAAAHGVPTVAFAIGGIPDAIGEGSGQLVPPDDYAAFADAVSAELARDPESRRAACIAWARSHDWSLFGRQLRSETRR